ncbi:MAG TPA: NAD(P)-binding domain-containing protein [Puia sp.]|nr:NAD(P)-binding domain-containing protein [Puia sp.]
MKQTNTLIIGASISGLASAACLQKRGIGYTMIEKENRIAAPWYNHYDRLHLHTNKALSNLPYKKFDKKIPRYPSREQVIEYLEDYQQAFDIHPVFNSRAESVKREADFWITKTSNGVFKSKYLILATGAYGKPKAYSVKGIETFPGNVLHSSRYKTGRNFNGKKVLIIGFGNSACEIAIDLYEQGAIPSMSVRYPVNIIPRDILGISVLRLGVLLSKLPPRLADTINAPLLSILIGDITKLGLQKMPYGVFEQIRKDRTIPVLDFGTVKHIRKGHISIHENIDQVEGNTVHFADGEKENFDSIITAIGYHTDFAEFVQVDMEREEDLKMKSDRQKYFGKDGLYACGFWIGPTGVIREISLDAQRIAKHIAGIEKSPVNG